MSNAATFIPTDADVILPSSIDWRAKNAVTGVKDQGSLFCVKFTLLYRVPTIYLRTKVKVKVKLKTK